MISYSFFSSIKNPNPLTLIPIIGTAEGVDVGKAPKGSSISHKLDFSLDGNGTGDSSPLESMKYNLRPRSKDTLDFLGTMVGGLGFFEEIIPKYNRRGMKYYMSMALQQYSSEGRCGKQLSLIRAL